MGWGTVLVKWICPETACVRRVGGVERNELDATSDGVRRRGAAGTDALLSKHRNNVFAQLLSGDFVNLRKVQLCCTQTIAASCTFWEELAKLVP